jgi:uncharacterized protein (DUF2225 family)
MIKCPYCKKSFDYQDIIIGTAEEHRFERDQTIRNKNIAITHYIVSCPHCETFLGCSKQQSPHGDSGR